MSGFIPPSQLAVMQAAAAQQYTTLVNWTPMGAPDLHGKRTPGPTVQLSARVQPTVREFYTADGARQVAVVDVFLPPNSTIQPHDTLVIPGENAARPSPILSVATLPSPDNPVEDRVTKGSA